jgi:hypothetical protein
MSSTQHIIAVGRLEGKGETLAAALAKALGLTMFEARSRVRGPAPRVVAVLADRGRAEAAMVALQAAGLWPLLVQEEDLEHEADRVAVRAFKLLPGAVELEARDGQRLTVHDGQFRWLLKGTTWERELITDVNTVRKFSPGKALLTGGLMLTSKKKIETNRQELHTEGFLAVGLRDGPTLMFREKEVQYQGLGPAMQPTRFANFVALAQELRRRAPSAFYDERLMSPAGQAHLLGPTLPPEENLDLAIWLLAAWGARA